MTFGEAIGQLEHIGLPAGAVRLQVTLIKPESPARLKSQVLEAFVRLRDQHDLRQVRRLGLEQDANQRWLDALRRVREEVRASVEGLSPGGLTWEQLLGAH